MFSLDQLRSNPDAFQPVATVSRLVGLSGRTLYALLERRELPSYRFGGRIMVKNSDLLSYIDSCRQEAEAIMRRTGESR